MKSHTCCSCKYGKFPHDSVSGRRIAFAVGDCSAEPMLPILPKAYTLSKKRVLPHDQGCPLWTRKEKK